MGICTAQRLYVGKVLRRAKLAIMLAVLLEESSGILGGISCSPAPWLALDSSCHIIIRLMYQR
jgi:hypothetical protein